jgi:hypothetical protein
MRKISKFVFFLATIIVISALTLPAIAKGNHTSSAEDPLIQDARVYASDQGVSFLLTKRSTD